MYRIGLPGVLYLSLSFVALQAETLVVFGDDAYAPVVFLVDGNPAGVLPDILSRAEALTGDRYQLQLSPWRRAYELARRGEGGVVGISYTEERAALFDFSKPLYEDNIQIVTLNDRTFPFAHIEDLQGKTVGGVNGASYGTAVDQAIADGLFTVDRDVGQAGRLRKLLAGRLDAAFIGNGMAGFNSVIDSHQDLRDNRNRFTILPTPLTHDQLYLAFAKSLHKQAVLDRFNVALDKLASTQPSP